MVNANAVLFRVLLDDSQFSKEFKSIEKQVASITKKAAAGFAITGAAIAGATIQASKFEKGYKNVLTLLDSKQLDQYSKRIKNCKCSYS